MDPLNPFDLIRLSIPPYLANLFADPLKSFRFLISIDGLAVGAFSQFSGIKMEVQTIQARGGNDHRGVQTYVPVLTTYEPVTLTKGVIGQSEFANWIYSAAADRVSGPTGSGLRKTVEIIALDDMGAKAVIWTLKDAMPIRYEVSPMDGTRSEVLTESLTLAYTGMSRSVSFIRLLVQTLTGRA